MQDPGPGADVGRIGARGRPDVDDELHFQQGRFWSTACIRCGFRPGACFTREVGDEIHFRGEMAGEGGRFHYEGVAGGGRVQASIRWVKKRWYRTLDRELEFAGAADAARQALPVAEAREIAERAGREQPASCPPWSAGAAPPCWPATCC